MPFGDVGDDFCDLDRVVVVLVCDGAVVDPVRDVVCVVQLVFDLGWLVVVELFVEGVVGCLVVGVQCCILVGHVWVCFGVVE